MDDVVPVRRRRRSQLSKAALAICVPSQFLHICNTFCFYTSVWTS